MSTPDQTTATGLSADEKRSIETLYRAFSEQNPDLLDEACWPDWQDIPLAPGQEPGTAGFKKLMPYFFAALPDLKIEVDEIIGCSGRAGVRARMVGTHLGELFGVPASHRRVEIILHEFHHFRDGRLSHTWHLEDWFGMFRSIGSWPPAVG